MASNGLLNRAKNGKCRVCQRVRSTEDKVQVVGEVRHGFATGHIWQCKDKNDCKIVAQKKLEKEKTETLVYLKIKDAIENYLQ
jgi:hypothetical protein